MTSSSFLKRLADLMHRHYSAPMAVMFKQFRDGAIYFAVGLMVVLMANVHMPPSVSQEVVTLLGLLMGSIGFIMAMLAQVRMIIARVLSFISQ